MIKNFSKKIIALVMLIALIICYAAKDVIFNYYYTNFSEAYADPISSEADFKFDSKAGEIIKYIGKQPKVVIPDTINGEAVTGIRKNAFADCSKLEKITISDSITNIGINAFGNCINLKNILVKYNNKYYTSIDGVLFNKLKTEIIKYPEGKKETNYTIPKSVVSIGDGTFISSHNLTNITIPNSVTSIGEKAFNGCNGLASINIPDGVTNIGNNAFGHCNKLINIKIPSGVKDISSSEFADCISLESVTISNSVVSIGDSAFYGCIGLKHIEIPDNVTSIGSGAFYGCSNLEKVTIPNGLVSIEKYAFYECVSLADVTIPSSVTSIGKNAFLGCVNTIFYLENEKTKELLLQIEDNSATYMDSSKIVIN
ncbi:leucine-rich repeat domain-containing protein [Clostridium saccharoperbutylacetonicum]|uniref:leucine-rich repeat domain-containing protein n=1 Tax=Clostridium saccharoperbutylacetonicum TaxID=36745 RepID=UPI0039EB4979